MNEKTNRICVKDEDGKILLESKNNRVLVGRSVGMSEETKQMILEFFIELTGEDGKRIKAFLDFESDENEFCS